jgi:hypothetical protein
MRGKILKSSNMFVNPNWMSVNQSDVIPTPQQNKLLN